MRLIEDPENQEQDQNRILIEPQMREVEDLIGPEENNDVRPQPE